MSDAAVGRIDEPGQRFRILLDRRVMFPEELEAWQTYLRRHGVDPDDVAVPGLLKADDTARTLSWLAYDRDAEGRIRRDDRGVVHVNRAVQLEAPALAFPDEADDWPFG